ncbi:hypothetical protein LZ32DRAFT_60556 [Colletotrichum eremochloae]|nr:hypothetical protein LZ32DRAFT_60556 [Colletotrichum eremochloae]
MLSPLSLNRCNLPCRLAAPAEPLALSKSPFSTSELPRRHDRTAHAIAYSQTRNQTDEPPSRKGTQQLLGWNSNKPHHKHVLFFFPWLSPEPRLNPSSVHKCVTSHSPAEKCQPLPTHWRILASFINPFSLVPSASQVDLSVLACSPWPDKPLVQS